ncbi:MAG: hypothetical protein N3A60_12425 [Thermanaerothrix sp.]|nr:hypothetical protein [Thermanaerothrix sp.]
MSTPITKTFRGRDMLSALHQVQQEFGADAIVVSLREVPGGAPWQIWRKPMYEVIAMKNPSTSNSVETKQTVPIPNQGQNNNPDGQRNDIRPNFISPKSETSSPLDILLQISQEPSACSFADTSKEGEALPGALSKIYHHLQQQGIDETIIQWTLNAARLGLPPEALEDETKVRFFVQRHLEGGIRTAPPPIEQLQGVLIISGLSGSGKTSLCARLGAYAVRVLQRHVAWLTLDTVRTAALNEARTFVDLLGIPLLVAYTPDEFRHHLQTLSSDFDLILVDTPALNPYSEDALLGLASFLGEATKRKLYVTLPATAKENDLYHLINALSPFRIQGLVFTKLDETLSLGSLYNLAWKTQIPIAFFMQGRRVLDDLHPAVASRLVKSILGEVHL